MKELMLISTLFIVSLVVTFSALSNDKDFLNHQQKTYHYNCSNSAEVAKMYRDGLEDSLIEAICKKEK